MLSKKEIKKFKSLLIKEKKHIGKTLKKIAKVDFGVETDADEDEADEVEEMVNNNATALVLKKRLENIESAISKIDNGKYGICEKCGKEISPKLLEIDPESKLCQHCKKEV